MTEPKDPFAPPPSTSRGPAGTRIAAVQLATYGTVIVTAIALIVYFALRG
jgi:hypothetical protein